MQDQGWKSDAGGGCVGGGSTEIQTIHTVCRPSHVQQDHQWLNGDTKQAGSLECGPPAQLYLEVQCPEPSSGNYLPNKPLAATVSCTSVSLPSCPLSFSLTTWLTTAELIRRILSWPRSLGSSGHGDGRTGPVRPGARDGLWADDFSELNPR